MIFFQLCSDRLTRGHNYRLIKPICNNNARAYSFSCRCLNCWNSLPACIVNATSTRAFKNYLNSANLDKYVLFKSSHQPTVA